MKIIRILLLLILLALSIWSGWYTYQSVFSLLDFQITAYKMLLQTGEQISTLKEGMGGAIQQLVGFFGVENGGAPSLHVDGIPIQESIASFESKLKLISGIIGLIVGLLVWKVLFDIVFGFTRMITKVTTFIS